MTVYDFVVAMRAAGTEGAIINKVPVSFTYNGGTLDLIHPITGEVVLTLNKTNQATYTNDLEWLTSDYKAPETNELVYEYVKYIPDLDVTIIFEDTWFMENGVLELAQGDITGYYHGEPSPECTEIYRHTYVRK